MLKVVYFNTLVGHLALALTGLGKEKNIYVSFYHRSPESPVAFRFQNLLQDGILRHGDNEEDHDAGIYKIIWIPTEEYCGYGLSEHAMYEWFKHDFKPKHTIYTLFGHNCSSVVFEMLRVGQKKSNTLNHQEVLPWSCFMETPGSISAYAEAVKASILQKLKSDEGAFNRLVELHSHSVMANTNAYMQLYAWAVRLRQFNQANQFGEIINKPFCRCVKKTLRLFQARVVKDKMPDPGDKLMTMSSSQDLPPVDLELHLDRLLKLADFLSLYVRRGLYKEADQLLQDLIHQVLFARMGEFLNYLMKSSFMNREEIVKELAIIRKKVIDENNPHANLCFAGSLSTWPRLSS